MDHLFPLAAFAVALLYSSVGHGGASGYLALGVLMGLDALALRGQALQLNVLAAGVAALAFARAGHLRPRLLLPLLLTAAPAAFFTARASAAGGPLRLGLGLALGAAALRFLLWPAPAGGAGEGGRARRAPWPLLAALGAALGALAGLTGVGGGIYLSPLLLLAGWAGLKECAAVSAAFIVVNSLASLAGLASAGALAAAPPSWLLSAAVGALAGSGLGSGRLGPAWLARILAGVLGLAGAKLLFH